MDEPKLSTSPHDLRDRTGADPAPAKDSGRRSDDNRAASHDQVQPPEKPLPAGSHVVYCDNELEVQEGFAIALRMMGLEQK
jgi:hypothetical protein